MPSHRCWKWILCGCLTAAGVAPARAQKYEISPVFSYVHIGRPALGSISPNDPQDNDSRFTNSPGYGVRLTWNTWQYYGNEIGYLRLAPIFRTIVRDDANPNGVLLEDKVKVHLLFYNFMIYFMPRNERWRPFVTGGLQAYQYGRPHFPDFPEGKTRHFGGNWGGGIKIRLASHAQARVDFRDYIGGKPYDLTFATASKSGGIMHMLEGSVGIGLTF